ncbi:polysaccharide deacetylase family protein [Microbispora sp. RL4-1S]|uniref:Polysaccharide deacetylase family protein n=1 Tax=Microbispora oryzae TaxID=2806554 RepID=A0A940WKP7_9ACTN|nr:polysaccharide deacetylase family protein [Microbispora oryzae]MBP2703260.1 polysaccharide deacetylase family protein [Microbispora oryzae]
MRIGSVLLALLVLAGCGQVRASDPDAAAQAPMPEAMRQARAARFDPGVLRLRLVGAQPGWPGPRLPVAPPPRRIDCTHARCVALTFDDGPGENTGRLLDILAAHHARATFFLLGQMVTKETQGFVRRMVAEGHEVGNHSWDHASLTGLSGEALARELERTQAVVRQVAGVRMRLMRPPYGATDHKVEEATRREGLSQIMWALDTLDWRDRNAGIVAGRCGAAKPGDIVLMHDIHPTTVEAVPRLLDELDRKGYTYVTVSELLGSPVPGKQYFNR